MKSYYKALKHYADFRGRATSDEYWNFQLFYVLFLFVAMVLDNKIGSGIYKEFFTDIYVLFFFIPSISITVRRLHDIGKSGWMLFIILLPIIGFVWLLVLLLSKSKN